jgi:hypothetical protein
MSNSPVMYEIVVDGVRATVQREDQGCSILLAPAAPADDRALSGEMPAVREALAAAETWLAAQPKAHNSIQPGPAPA